MTDNLTDPPRRTPSVFLSYADDDRDAVFSVAERLRAAGISTWWNEHLEPGHLWGEAIASGLQSSDFVLIFVSAASARSLYAGQAMKEALEEFNNRSITPLPLLLDDAVIPASLSGLQFVDLRQNFGSTVQHLVERIQATLDIDFSTLSPSAFEDLVGDVLRELGFATEREAVERGMQFDYRATVRTQDPFGAWVDEAWLIEVKHHKAGRLSVAAIRQFVAMADFSPGPSRLALITSGQITSAGRDYISRSRVRLVEGVELRRILLTRPHLIRRHLTAGLK